MTKTLIAIFCVLLVSSPTSGQSSRKTSPQIINLKETINSQVYPKSLKKEPKEGRIVLDIWLDREGEIMKFKTIIAENEELRQFVEERVRHLKFLPARNELGVAIYSKVRLPFEISLDPEKNHN